MPGRDGTGPLGQGAATGRGFGPCVANNAGYAINAGFRGGRGCRRRFFGKAAAGGKSPLTAEREQLEKRLEIVKKQLGEE